MFRRVRDLEAALKRLERTGAWILVVQLGSDAVLQRRNRLRHPRMYMKEATLERLAPLRRGQRRERVRDNSGRYAVDQVTTAARTRGGLLRPRARRNKRPGVK